MNNSLQVSQTLNLKQSLSLKQIQYLKLLAMNVTELDDYLNTVYEENPVVDLNKSSEEENSIDFFSYLNSSREMAVAPSKDDEAPSEITPKEKIFDEKENLFAFIKSQFDFSLRDFDIGLLDEILSSFDEKGYFLGSEEKIAEKGYDLSLVKEALSYIQSLEPAGIGAKNLSQCLEIQLKRRNEEDEDAYKIVESHLEDLSKGHFGKIAKALGCDVEKVRDLYEKIKKLNPIPASGFGAGGSFSYIIPDVTVVYDENGLSARYNKAFESSITINQEYIDLASKDKNAEKYIKEKLNQALWVMKAVSSRRDTIEKIVSCILKTQKGFFTDGKSLKPLKLKDIAKELSIHESTVSRAVNDKFLECQRGVFPLKYFFTTEAARPKEAEGAISAESLKERIKEIIDKENKEKPLSDMKIIDILSSDGIMIARRTVAKYREEMGIPASSLRKVK